MMNKNYLLIGITDLLILSILNKNDHYALGIAKEISEVSEGLLTIPPNTIYTAIYKLEAEHMLSEYPKLVGKKRTRIYYHLEPAGKEYLDKIYDRYSNMIKGVQKLFDSLDAPPE